MERFYYVGYVWWHIEEKRQCGIGSCLYKTSNGSPVRDKRFFVRLEDKVRMSCDKPNLDKKLIIVSINEMLPGYEKYIIEVRDSEGGLDFTAENAKRKEHPFLFSKGTFRIDELCYYASFGQGRSKPIGPMELKEFMDRIGISYRKKTW